MRKIGKNPTFFAVVFYLLLSSAAVFGQQIEVTAEFSETNIYQGEQVALSIKVSGQSIDSVEEPELPPFSGLRWLQGSTSRGSQYSIINGRPSVAYTFGFQFIAEDIGSHTFPSVTVEVNGKTYQTDPISFKVLDPASVQNAERSPDIYIRLETNEDEPVVGQQIIADIILYFKSGIEVSSYQSIPGWKAEGFWKEELQNPQRAQTTSTIINGVRYQRARLLQYALFPTKTGELTLSPFQVTVSVRQQNSRNPFGFGFGQERRELSSLPVTLNVKPLPEIEDVQFVGAVGKFSITREIVPEDALVGESIEVKTRISGTGNVPLINKPEFDYPEALEEYNPQENSEIYRQNRVISGFKSFTDVLIARNAGTFIIPEEKLAYFDPHENRYHIVTLPPLTMEIKRDPEAIAASPEQLRLNILPVTGLAAWESDVYTPLHKQPVVWILLISPIFLTGIMYGFILYRDRMNTDTAFARSRKAHKKAEATLKEAEQTDDIKEGYHLIEKALYQFISDKYNLPPAGLNTEKLISAIEPDAGKSLKENLRKLLNKCESIAYAPNATQQGRREDINKTREMIKEIGK